MSQQKAGSLGPIIGLWAVAAAIECGWAWATNMDGECSMVGDGGPLCFTQTLLHGVAPTLSWMALIAVALAVVASLVIGWRRLVAR